MTTVGFQAHPGANLLHGALSSSDLGQVPIPGTGVGGVSHAQTMWTKDMEGVTLQGRSGTALQRR